ncbi:MAG: phage tail tube protein [Fervidobacterium sp.]
MPLVGGSSSVILYIPDGTNTYKIKLPMKSESINPKYNSVVSSEALLGQRAPKGTYIGQLTYEGSIEVELFDLTDATTTSEYKHALLGLLFLSIFGQYSSDTVSLNNSSGQKLPAVIVNHGGSSITYLDVYVTSLRVSFTTDGIATATLDVRARATGSYTEGTIKDLTSLSYVNPYTAKNIAVKVGSNNVTTKVSRFELNISQDVIDYYTFGSLNAQGISASRLGMAEVTIEYYPDSVSTIDLDAALNSAFTSGTASASGITVEIASPSSDTIKATLTLSNAFVTEYTHDINGPEYITSTLGLQVSPDNITLSGVDIDPTV